MGNLATNLFGVGVNVNHAHVVNNTMQNIKTQCATGNRQEVEVENVEIKIKNLDCSGNVCVFVQSTNADLSCVTNTALNTISTIMAQQAAGTQNTGLAGGVNGRLNIGGVQVNVNDQHLQNTIAETIKQICGTGNTVVDKFDDVEVDLGRVKCDNFNVLQQDSSLSVNCYMKATAQAYNDNTSLQGAGNSNNNLFGGLPKGAIIGIIVVVALMVIGGIIVTVVEVNKHKQAEKDAANQIRTGQPAKGQGACHAAAVMGRPPPTGCDLTRIPKQSKAKVPPARVRVPTGPVPRARPVQTTARPGGVAVPRRGASTVPTVAQTAGTGRGRYQAPP